MRRPPVLAAALVAGASAFPAGAAAAPTSWDGWHSIGPPPRVGMAADLAATGSTQVTLGTFSARRDGLVRFAVRSAAGDRSGIVPPVVDRYGLPVTDDSLAGRPAVHLAGPGTVVVWTSCATRASTDTGARWSVATLPGCRIGPTADRPPAFAFADREHGVVALGGDTWTTGDGARSWVRTPGSAGGDVVGMTWVSGTSYVRVVTSPGSAVPPPSSSAPGYAVQRSDDGGRTWTSVPIPLPGLAPGDPPRAPGTPEAVAALPAPLSAPVRRADGAVLVGGPGEVLVSADGARTFTAVDVPVPPPYPGRTGTPVPRSVQVGPAVCDPTSRCILPRSVSPATDSDAVRFDGAAVGADVPEPPIGALAPTPGRIVGLGSAVTSGSNPAGPIVASPDLGATYAQEHDGSPAPLVGDPGLIAVVDAGRITYSPDRGASFRTVPDPQPSPYGYGSGVRVTRTPAGLVALSADDRLRRSGSDGAWADLADVSAVAPEALTSADGVVLVAGPKGLARVAPDGRVRIVRTAALGTTADGASPMIRAHGTTAIAWDGTVLLRSTDAGRTWRRSPTRTAYDDLRVVSDHTVIALAGRTISRSRDGGRTFSRVAVVPPVRSIERLNGPTLDEGLVTPALDAVGTRRMVVADDDGTFVTRDGGRTFAPVPVPTNEPPAAAFLAGRRGAGVVVRDGASGMLYRAAGRRRPAATLTLGLLGRPRASGGSRAQRVVGRIRHAPLGDGLVQLLARGPHGERQAAFAVSPGAHGRFVARVRLRPEERSVRAVFGGRVDVARTWRPGTSRALPVPALRRGRGRS